MFESLVISFLISIIGTFISIYFFINFSEKFGLIDYPSDRKVHKRPIPKIGGISMVFAFLIVFIYYLIFNHIEWPFSYFEFGLFLSTMLIILAGVLDDFYTITAYKKFLFQFLAAMILISIDFKFIFNTGQTSYVDFLLSNILTVIYIVGVTNSINLIDGLDGLVSHIYIIIAVAFMSFAIILGLNDIYFYLFVPFIAATLAFLRFNRFPAKIFLGDTGSLLMGWSFACFSIFFSQQVIFGLSLLVPFILLGLPISDTLIVMSKRFYDSGDEVFIVRFKSMFKADKSHIHHLILRSGFSINKTVYIICSIVLLNVVFSFISIFYNYKVVLVGFLFMVFFLTFFARKYFSKFYI
ncbi:MAG: hypothetical protein CMG00_04180 [Candidatus Marinimicrobia bacterium]|nr:hypothetical protein [Candidatus Neomarinimicrobiota bacterium]|tara:strand:+ start:66 stop:1124 length:1059 start_codon:yes stop_codon:yes gene_type:complete